MAKQKKQFLDGDANAYESMKLPELKMLLDERDIPQKGNKEEMIKTLLDDDAGKYIRETIVEKDGDFYLIGIALNNSRQFIEIGKQVEKGEAKCLNRYSSNRIWYQSKQKPI